MGSTVYDIYFSLSKHFKMSSAISFNLDQSKFFSSGNGLRMDSLPKMGYLQTDWNCVYL